MATSYWTTAALHHGRDLSEGLDAFLERHPAVFNRPPGR
jgi:enoyl-CoA hydratase